MDKLRNTVRLGAALDTTTGLSMSLFFLILIVAATKNDHTSKLVELKVRMNN